MPAPSSLDYLISVGVPRDEAIRLEAGLDQINAAMTRDQFRDWFVAEARKCLALRDAGMERLVPPGFART